ncbi:hypothetical protein [uncultured Acetobacteroides sp.]|uniref:hypothetical protein n=1 Tax=uncultured Acetobacteroides sp. TaxID=1760811 RepID=UPI0029F59CFF|nr:hypothetical protein [uncultured Acetobacteroides sp.]
MSEQFSQESEQIPHRDEQFAQLGEEFTPMAIEFVSMAMAGEPPSALCTGMRQRFRGSAQYLATTGLS